MLNNNYSNQIKKNLLDLKYNKNLQYYNTSIILLFTYFIGIAIAFITKQIDYTNLAQLFLTGIISIVFISTIVIFMLRFRAHLKIIPEEIKKL